MTAEPPVMRGWPLIGAAYRILNPLAAIREAHAKYGDFVRVDLGVIGSIYLAFHPDDVKEVFGNGRRLHRGVMRELLGPGLFVAPSSDTSLRHRRLMQPAYHANHLARLVETISETTAAVIAERWPRPGEPVRAVDVVDELKKMTIAITVRITLGDAPAHQLCRAEEALAFVADYLDVQLFDRIKWPRSFPTRANREFRTAMRDLHALIQRRIDLARQTPAGDDADLLGMFVRARDAATGEAMTDAELHDEVLSTFVAGVETTYMAITWSLWMLAHNPATRDALRAEVATMPERGPSLAGLRQIPYAKMAVQEALRLYPVAWGMLRTMDRDVTLSGYPIPAESKVFVCPFVTGRHAAFWSDPEAYDPTRFTADKIAARPRFAYFPFGGGKHQCIGNELALMESQIVLAMLAQRYEIAMDPVADVKTRARIALQPDPHPMMRVRPAPAAPMAAVAQVSS
ncbi:MAG TPA: cytochrome P450 [Kofleriaceae bacterium]|nr:cytochrome P450 [Kofleriaceae bacterium]